MKVRPATSQGVPLLDPAHYLSSSCSTLRPHHLRRDPQAVLWRVLWITFCSNVVASSPAPPAPPCTVANLKARTAGDKGWPIACANVVIGDKTQDLDLNSASLSYGDFEGATFNGEEKIDLQGAGLENANLRGSKFEMIRDDATSSFKKKSNRIIFTDADLENADLSLSTFYADSKETYDNKVSAEG